MDWNGQWHGHFWSVLYLGPAPGRLQSTSVLPPPSHLSQGADPGQVFQVKPGRSALRIWRRPSPALSSLGDTQHPPCGPRDMHPSDHRWQTKAPWVNSIWSAHFTATFLGAFPSTFLLELLCPSNFTPSGNFVAFLDHVFHTFLGSLGPRCGRGAIRTRTTTLPGFAINASSLHLVHVTLPRMHSSHVLVENQNSGPFCELGLEGKNGDFSRQL